MHETIKITLAPHPDIELNTERSEIEAFITLPEEGVNSETGVIMVIPGLGEYGNSDYHASQLRPYLANKLNCIAVGVNYFGIFRNGQIQIRPSFLHNINRIYGLNLSFESFADAQGAVDVYRKIAEAVLSRGVTSLDLRCQPHLLTGRDEYQSWGFLPAIDCLQVLGEILQRYDLNQRKIIACGKHYGAYVAMLMGKYAPHSFSAIVDQEGHCRTILKHVVSGELMEADYMFSFTINDDLSFYIASTCNNPWTIEDETSLVYFSDNHRKIRSLLYEGHRIPSETRYHIFHPEESPSIADKDCCVEILERYNFVNYHRVKDGGPISFDSDQDLFDWLVKNDDIGMQKSSADTDFSLNKIHEFACGDKSYRFEYNENGKIQVTME